MCGASAERAPRRELAPDPSDQGDLARTAPKPLMLSDFPSCHYITYLVRTNLYLKRHGLVGVSRVSPSWSGKYCGCRAVRVASPPTLPGLGGRDAGGREMGTARCEAIYRVSRVAGGVGAGAGCREGRVCRWVGAAWSCRS